MIDGIDTLIAIWLIIIIFIISYATIEDKLNATAILITITLIIIIYLIELIWGPGL